MSSSEFDAAAYLPAAAMAADLPIDDACRPGVVRYLALCHAIARPLLDFPLPETVEPAPVFRP